MKTKITKKEYLQLVGLMAVAFKHRNIMYECELLMNEIVGEKERYGHLSDELFGDGDVEQALKRMDIKVIK